MYKIRRSIGAIALALVCTACSLRDTDADLRATYRMRTQGLSINAVRLRTAGLGAALGGGLALIPVLVPKHHRLITVVPVAIIDTIVVVLLSEREVYDIGAITAREHECPSLIEQKDLYIIGRVWGKSAMEAHKEIEQALDEPAMPATAAAIVQAFGQSVPTRRVLMLALASQILQEAGRNVPYGEVLAFLIGSSVNSIALNWIGGTAKEYYEEKATRTCTLH